MRDEALLKGGRRSNLVGMNHPHGLHGHHDDDDDDDDNDDDRTSEMMVKR
jgi:hypothetical protein